MEANSTELAERSSIHDQLGGPIIKNKTFFFALWDQNINNNRTLVTTNVLTDAARQGILRYWSGWNPGNAHSPSPIFRQRYSGIYPSVDATGKPVAPLSNPKGTPYTGGLQCFSVFGSTKFDGSPFTAADCAGTGPALLPVGRRLAGIHCAHPSMLPAIFRI